MKQFLTSWLLVCFCSTVKAANVTPSEYLATLPSPGFTTNEPFPKLSIWSEWEGTNTTILSNTVVELAKNWGYSINLGSYAEPNTVANITVPGTFENGVMLLCSNQPNLYQMAVIMDRSFTNPPSGFYCTNAAGLFTDGSNTWASLTNQNFSPVMSPEAPDNYLQAISQYWVNTLKAVQSNCPVKYIIDGGENGLEIAFPQAQTAGGALNVDAWRQDPRVQAATNTYPGGGNNLGPYLADYYGDRVSNQMSHLTGLIRSNFPSRVLHVYFTTGAEQTRTTLVTNWPYQNGFYPVSSKTVPNFDYPSEYSYFEPQVDNVFTNRDKFIAQGQSVPCNLLNMFLNGVAAQQLLGYTNEYGWVCGGYTSADSAYLGDLNIYAGFLKCRYVGGMVGGIAGYFSRPGPGCPFGGDGFSATFDSTCPPNWLNQLIQLSYVHKLFSQNSALLTTNSILISDHAGISSDRPSYELTNSVGRLNSHVVCRRVNSNLWIACAWAADGVETNLLVNIPSGPTVTLNARTAGTVYTITGNSLTQIDKGVPVWNGTGWQAEGASGYIESAIIQNLIILGQ